ncbi:bifunctional DNA primase/polymerase [Nonomuraea rubra]
MTHDLTDQLQWVAWLQSLGMHLHPLDHPTLPTCAGRHGPRNPCDGKRGKHPATAWSRTATNDLGVLQHLFGQAPRNIGIACKPSGLLVVDEDQPNALADYAASIGQAVPATFAVRTGRVGGGMHHYYGMPPGVQLGNGLGDLKGRNIDIRGGGTGNGGYVVAPGSLHETGAFYELVDANAPVLPAPDWLIEALQANTTPPAAAPLFSQPRPAYSGIAPFVEDELARHTGDRSEDFARVAGACKRAGMTPEETADLLIQRQHPSAQKYAGRVLAEVHRVWPKLSERRATDHVDPATLIAPVVDGNLATVHHIHPVHAVTPPVLPEDFWQARPLFAHVRQAAYSRLIAPDGVMAAVLIRAATALDYRVLLPAVVGRPAALNLFGALAAGSGGGKGASLDAAAELVPFANTQNHRIIEVSAGSGEGLVKKFFARVEEKDSNNKPTGNWQWEQQVEGMYLRVDEGSLFGPLSQRKGQTTVEMLRQAWSGERLGGSYASEDRGHQLAPHTYRMCLIMGIQPEIAGFLFDDVHGGLPQRFLWLAVQSPEMPDLDNIPMHPGALTWHPPVVDARHLTGRVNNMARHLLDIAPEVAREIRAAHLDQVTGRAAADPLDGHANLSRLKVAAVLAALDDHLGVRVEDWELSRVVMDTSRAVRRWMQQRVQATDAATRKARNVAHAEREVLAESAKETAKLTRMAKRAHRYVDQLTSAGQKATKREINKRFGGSEKPLLEDALDHALGLDWIRRDGDVFVLGESMPK